MATVTGVTAERAQEIENASVTGARISDNDLVLVTKGGTEVNVGRIIPPAVNNWPVGSIFMNTTPTNPATLLDGGTWVRWGKGRVPVSIDEAQVEFDGAEEVGGAKTHTMAIAHMPSHSHGGGTGWMSADHSHTGYTSTDGSHQHGYIAQQPAAQTDNGSWNYYTGRVGAATDPAGSHSHGIQTYGASANHYHSITAEGSGTAFNIMQPYITVYMWKRTA